MHRILVPLALIMALALPAGAVDCAPSTTKAEVDTGDHGFGAPRYYVDSDSLCIFVHCEWTVWVYEESNGIDGLQRGDEVVDDTCGGQIESDTVIF